MTEILCSNACPVLFKTMILRRFLKMPTSEITLHLPTNLAYHSTMKTRQLFRLNCWQAYSVCCYALFRIILIVGCNLILILCVLIVRLMPVNLTYILIKIQFIIQFNLLAKSQ